MPSIDLGTGIAIFGVAFGAWAWVVMWGVNVMRREFSELKGQVQSMNATHNAHVIQTERRLTMLESDFQYVKARLGHEPRHEQ